MADLSYTFLGTESFNGGDSIYTPLIIPGGLANSMSDASIPSNPVQSIQQPNGSESQIQDSGKPTPFSKIKNYTINNISQLDKIPQQRINVVNDYMWTISPKTSKTGKSMYRDFSEINDEVPYVLLKEKFFLVNNLIAQALYTLSSTLDSFGAGAFDSFKNDVTSFLSKRNNLGVDEDTTGAGGEQSAADQQGQPTLSPAGTTAPTESSNTNSVIDIATDILEKTGVKGVYEIVTKFRNPDLEKVLFPYQRLYILGPTGFTYKLPYLNKNVLNAKNSFSEGGGQNAAAAIQSIVDTATSITETIAGTARILNESGSAKIERSKFYNYPSQGDPIDLVLPLYNTRPATFNDIKNNFKLILLLLYQNLPLRQDKIIVEPPVIYDLTIPGNRRSPYCYLSSLTVEYKGATRLMDIPTTGIYATDKSVELPETIQTIIPDMYQIRFSFQPMVATTKNLLFASYAKDGRVRAEFAGNPILSNNNSFDPIKSALGGAAKVRDSVINKVKGIF